MGGTVKIIVVVPARLAATRFPNKPLAKLLGLEMVEHVRRRVLLSKLVSEVVVATCDREIKQAVERYGGKAVMTADTHERCTDRVEEAMGHFAGFDIVVNVQGDEPLIMPHMIDDVVRPLIDDPSLECANLVVPIVDDREFEDPNAPKVVTNLKGDLLYISREPIPSKKKAGGRDYKKLKQLGIIAFRTEFLKLFSRLAPTPHEIVESVDMNRAVEHGYRVRMVETKGRMIGVDLPGDVQRVELLLKDDPLVGKYIKEPA